jgi:[acyl-carrier-protein] S-malonyltransferase
MQKACELNPSTMAAILNLDDQIIAKICSETPGIVVPANFNCPGQVVISGSIESINTACEAMKAAGAKRALVLPVGGAFHSPLMEPARVELEAAIKATRFATPICPIYQNVNAKAVTSPDEIQNNLIAQLTAPVLWTQIVQQMIQDGAQEFVEVGPGKVLQGLVGKIDKTKLVSGIN